MWQLKPFYWQKKTTFLLVLIEFYCSYIIIKGRYEEEFSGNNFKLTTIFYVISFFGQVSLFNFVGCDITWEFANDIDLKIHRFQMMCGNIHRTLGNKARKDTKTKLYKIMVLSLIHI